VDAIDASEAADLALLRAQVQGVLDRAHNLKNLGV
jgi:hypothetical protein